MDWGYKAMLTAVTVAAVLMMAQMFGRRAAGILAGLPIISAPVYVWVAFDQGSAFAAQTAHGGVFACGLMAILWLIYERVRRNASAFFALAASLVVVTICARVGSEANAPLWMTFSFVLIVCVVALNFLPNPMRTNAPSKHDRTTLLLTAVVAGIASGLIGNYATDLGAFWSGMVASLPIMSLCVVIHQHLTATHRDVQGFLHGYVVGLIGKACFAATFSFAILHGELSTALVFSIALTVSLFLLAQQITKWVKRGAAPEIASESIYARTR